MSSNLKLSTNIEVTFFLFLPKLFNIEIAFVFLLYLLHNIGQNEPAWYAAKTESCFRDFCMHNKTCIMKRVISDITLTLRWRLNSSFIFMYVFIFTLSVKSTGHSWSRSEISISLSYKQLLIQHRPSDQCAASNVDDDSDHSDLCACKHLPHSLHASPPSPL